MNAISLSNRLPYRAIHKRFIIWSNNYSFSRYVDLLITNRPNLVLDIKVSPNFCSDHYPVSVDINIKTSKEQCYKRTIRKYDQADYNQHINV
jgi:radical SAM superfamily enzyme